MMASPVVLELPARERRFGRDAWIGLAVTGIAALIYWLSNRFFDAKHGDFFYLADAFLHGHTWIALSAVPPGSIGVNDVILDGDVFYVPFGPFPAIFFMPLVAVIGPVTADIYESGINAVLAASCVGLGWWLLGRIGARVPLYGSVHKIVSPEKASEWLLALLDANDRGIPDS